MVYMYLKVAMFFFIFIFDRIREKQLRESYILKYGDKVEGMKLNQSLIDTCMSHSNPCRCYCFYVHTQTVGDQWNNFL